MRTEIRMRLFVIILVCIHLSSCLAADCSESSEKVVYARALSKEQLSEIYFATLDIFNDHERFHYEGPLPETLKKHGIITIRVHKQIHLRLEGCLDDWVDLVVVDDVEDPKIELKYQRGKREILWRKNDA